ncbi:MAG: HNH endonuclease [Cetobacterium sp.]
MKDCSKCGEAKGPEHFYKNASRPSGVSDWCKSCMAEHYRGSADKIKDAARVRYQSNIEVMRERQRVNRDQDKHRERERLRRQSNNSRTPEQITEAQVRLRPGGVKTCRKCKVTLPLQTFRVNRGLADGLAADCTPCAVSAQKRLQRIAAFETRGLASCVYCSGPYQHIDHLYPVKLGGEDVRENLVPSCAPCNHRKGARHPEDWVAQVLPGRTIDELIQEWGAVKTWQNR